MDQNFDFAVEYQKQEKAFDDKIRALNRPVDIKDIEFRIQSVTKGGYATILAYKSARYDMNILDEVVGPGNWQRDHKVVDGNLYAGIGIYRSPIVVAGQIVTPGQWIWKYDVGVESQTEEIKGKASDSFKRAGFNWGIGRELYSFPFIGFQLNEGEFEVYKDVKRGKEIGRVKSFKVYKLEWYIERDEETHKITRLAAKYNGAKRYDMKVEGRKVTEATKTTEEKPKRATRKKAEPPKVEAPKPESTKVEEKSGEITPNVEFDKTGNTTTVTTASKPKQPAPEKSNPLEQKPTESPVEKKSKQEPVNTDQDGPVEGDGFVWLTKAQFETTMRAPVKGVAATINMFTKGNRRMRKEHLEKLKERLNMLTNPEDHEG